VTAYTPAAWETFAAANAGAAAALAGLLFVGVSINVQAIVQSRRLTDRAFEAFMLLVSTLVVSVLVLVPGITPTGLGIALTVVGTIGWLAVSWRHIHALPRFGGDDDGNAPRGSIAARITLGQLAVAPVAIAGVTLLVGSGGGLYWIVPAVIFAYVSALANAWVLLIEILR
jgi:modulator of FtsH protease